MVRLLEPHNGDQADLWRRLCDGTYNRPFVLDMGGKRQLHFDLTGVQSAMSLAEPERLVLSYTRKMASFLLFHARPRRLLLLGLGGGSLAKFCLRVLPECVITVVEANRDVILLRREFGIPDDDDRFEVIHVDGLDYMAGLASGYDVILADACDHEGTAPRLSTPDFYQAARNGLAPGGILVANICGYEGPCLLQLKALHDAFDGEAMMMPHRGPTNIIAYGFRDHGAIKQWRPIEASAVLLKRRTGINFPRYMRLLDLARTPREL